MPPRIPKGALSAIKEAVNAPSSLPQAKIPLAADQALGALVAYRQQAQLQDAARLLKLDPQQFTRAYAGDERSAKAVRKTMQEQENVQRGLPASPGRRKILKQAASTAIRASVPDQIADPLMRAALSPMEEGMARALEEANITPHSPDTIQKLFLEMVEGNMSDELNDIGSYNTMPLVLNHYLKNFYPKSQLQSLGTGLEKLKGLYQNPITYEFSPKPPLSSSISRMQQELAWPHLQEDYRAELRSLLEEIPHLPPEHNYSHLDIRELKKNPQYRDTEADPEFWKWVDSVPEGQSGYYGTRKASNTYDPIGELYAGELSNMLKSGSVEESMLVDREMAEALRTRISELNLTPEELKSLKHLEDNMVFSPEMLDDYLTPEMMENAPTKSQRAFSKWIEKLVQEEE